MDDMVKQPILSVTEFPWVGDPANPKTKEEYAYKLGQMVAQQRSLLDDESIEMIWNGGAGPSKNPYKPDIEKLNRTKQGIFGIFTAIEPEDLPLYRRLLPVNMSMPECPVLSLVNLDYNQPNPITRYREGMVYLKGVGADGEEAWYVHSVPVETWLMLVVGHDWGFRKELYDMTVTPQKSTVMQRDGDLYMSLELTDTLCPADTEWLIPQEHCGGHNNIAVIYPRNPDVMLRFGWTGRGVALEENKKMVKISVNPSLDWAGLVPDGTIAPGYYQRYTIDGGDAYIKKVRSK